MKCKIPQCHLPGPLVRCGGCQKPVCDDHCTAFESLMPLCMSCRVEGSRRRCAGMANATRGRARTFIDRKKEANRNACRGGQGV